MDSIFGVSSNVPGRLLKLGASLDCDQEAGLDSAMAASLAHAREVSQATFGPNVDFFLPGQFRLDRNIGQYPAISLTGDRCELSCEHCQGRLLRSMNSSTTPESLWQTALDLEARKFPGLLISGGCDSSGRLPWATFLPVIEQIVRKTRLIVTVHAGYLDAPAAHAMKNAGVRQVLVDVIGDDDTARQVYHLDRGMAPIWETLDALLTAELDIAPHIVVGLNFGRIVGEYQALHRLADYPIRRLITVVINPLRGTPMQGIRPPSPKEISRFLVAARDCLPKARHHLGCARPPGRHRRLLERLALRAGINALAVPGRRLLTKQSDSILHQPYIKPAVPWPGQRV